MEQHFGMVPNDGGNAAGTEFDHNFQDFSRKPNHVNPSPNRRLEKPFLRQGPQKAGQMSRPGMHLQSICSREVLALPDPLIIVIILCHLLKM
jgi:hypothetical protein